MSPQEQPMALVQAFVEAIHQQNWNRLTSVVAPNFIRHSYAGCEPSIYSRDDLVSFLKQEYTIFPDAQETIEALIASGDRVTVRHRFRGTQTGWMETYPLLTEC